MSQSPTWLLNRVAHDAERLFDELFSQGSEIASMGSFSSSRRAILRIASKVYRVRFETVNPKLRPAVRREKNSASFCGFRESLGFRVSGLGFWVLGYFLNSHGLKTSSFQNKTTS